MSLPSVKLTPTVFHQPWWLDISCDGRRGEVCVEHGGQVVGRLPFMRSRHVGFSVLRMPPLARVMGPALFLEGGAASRITREVEITSKLIAKLPKAIHIHMRLHSDVKQTIAFNAAGFQTGVDYTVRIAPVAPETLWKQMRDKTRNSIRRAREKLTVVELTEATAFADFYEANISEKQKSSFYEKAMISRLIAESIARGQGRTLALADAAGELKAAIFIVWDDRAAYYLMSTRCQKAENGAISLLLWHCIADAHKLGLTFDMAGIHITGSQTPNLLLTTGFGGEVSANYFVFKTAIIGKSAWYVKNSIIRR